MEAITYRIEDQVGERHWWFEGRRAILETVIRGMGLPPEPAIYDLGCGTGQNLIMLQTLGHATGVDMSADALAFARGRGCRSTLQGDLYQLPIADDTADLVVATDILEHLDDDVRGAAEIRRVLKPDGRGLITVPAFMWLWGTQDDVSHHKRRYTKAEVRRMLEAAGLVVEKLTYYNFLLFLPIFLGRALIKLSGRKIESENNLTPGAMNGLLRGIFALEGPWLRAFGFPVGVSVMAIVRKA